MLLFVGICQSTIVLQEGISANDFVIWTVYVLPQNRQNRQSINWILHMWTAGMWGGIFIHINVCYHVILVSVQYLLFVRGFFQKYKYSLPIISHIHILEPQLFPYVWLTDRFFIFLSTETVMMAGHTQCLRMWKCISKSSKVRQSSWRINGSKNLFILPLVGGSHEWSWRISTHSVCCISLSV